MAKSSELFSESGPTDQKAFREMLGDSIKNTAAVEEALKNKITAKLSGEKDQVQVKIGRDGIKIQMVDKEGREMFEPGSSKLTPRAKEILKAISVNIAALPNEISIEGHTDSSPLHKNEYTNWELSADRAASARRELELNGIDPARIARISGYADKDPLNNKDLNDPQNRRITVAIDPYIKIKKPIRDEKTGEIVAWKGVDNLTLKKLEEILFKTKNKLESQKDAGPQSKVSGQQDEHWGPIIKKEDWTPVVKDESIKPVISSDNWNPVVPGYKWDPIESKPSDFSGQADDVNSSGTVPPPDREDHSIKEIKEYFDSAIKGNIPTSPKTGIATSDAGKENDAALSANSVEPADRNDWGPVIKEDDWSPVIKKNNLDVIKN
jgi:outer membrane protein OmpA-like peptidoglycan-associated protein